MVRQIVVYKWRKFNTGVTVLGVGVLQRWLQRCCTSEDQKKSTWMLLAKYTLDRLNQSWVVWEKHTQNVMCGEKGTVQSTPISKPHLCCKVWRTGHHDLEKFCCLRAWTACYHQLKTEFPSLSGHFGRECTFEVGWCTRKTIQSAEVNQQQNVFNRRKYAFWSGSDRPWPQPICFVDGEWFTRHPENISELEELSWNWKSSVKRIGANFLLTIVQVWFTNTEHIWSVIKFNGS